MNGDNANANETKEPAGRVLSPQLLQKPKELTAPELAEIAKAAIGSVTEGYACPLEMMARYRAFEYYAESVMAGIEREALAEYERYAGGTKEIGWGLFTIAKTTVGSKWQYSHDPIWKSIQETIKDLEEQLAPYKEALKKREEFLRRLANSTPTEPLYETNEATGEYFRVLPAIHTAGKETLRFTIKRSPHGG